MKKLHKLMLQSWWGPFLVAFGTILFILVLQFLAKYIDDIFGKGLSAGVLGKVFVYACMTLVTLALPLGVLLSSLLTMGNLGERYELASLKSAGIGLFKIMTPLTRITLIITAGSLMFSFYVMPLANIKLYTLLYDLSKVKPTFALKADHFYTDIDGLVIHADEIDRERDVLYKIKIFDHSDKVGNNRITIADSGKMVPSQATGYLKMTLYDGVIHEEIAQEAGRKKDYQYQRFYFDTLDYQVPLSGFDLEESDENTFGTHHYMKNIHELDESLDSLHKRTDHFREDFDDYLLKYVHVDTAMNKAMKVAIKVDSTKYGKNGKIKIDKDKPVYDWFPKLDKAELVNKAIQHARAVKNYTTIVQDRLDREELKIRKFKIEKNNRWMLPVSCLVFLFLGAPLGAIIRKGGIGMPVIFSILFFIIFYILMIQGRKFARDEILPVWVGVWMPILVMFPMAMLFTYQSATDSAVLYQSGWYKIQKFLFGWLPFMKKKGDQRHTMSIEELIALRERQKRDAKEAIEKYEAIKNRKKSGKDTS